MARGLKKHLKRLNAPKHWMLDKLGGVFVFGCDFQGTQALFRTSQAAGMHTTTITLRNRLKCALTYKDVTAILMQRLVSIDGKIRTDSCYPAGFMDVVSMAKTGENFRLLFDTARVVSNFITSVLRKPSQYKPCKVRNFELKRQGASPTSPPSMVVQAGIVWIFLFFYFLGGFGTKGRRSGYIRRHD